VSTRRLRYVPTWADVLEECATEQATALRLVAQLGACEASALAFCRLLERWAHGEPQPATPGGRQAALRRAAERVETALSGLEEPLDRYRVTAVFHGHAHRGSLEGRTKGNAPVYNVAMPLLAASFADRQPVKIIEVPVGEATISAA